METGIVILVLVGYAGVLTLIVRSRWRRLSRENRKLNYHITDLWVAAVCMLPSCLAAAHFINERIEDRVGSLEFALPIAFLVVSQLAGICLGRLDIAIRFPERAASAFDSAVSILTGALIGLLFLPALGIVLLFGAVYIGMFLIR